MLHLIAYDLNRPGQNYALLYRAITESPCAKLTESCWLIRSDLTATQIRNKLAPLVAHPLAPVLAKQKLVV